MTRAWIRFAAAFGAVASAVFVTAGAALAQTSGGLAACAAFPSGAAYACQCAAGTGAGSVWGSDPYTGDSNVCTAAVHAGLLDAASGGAVQALPAPGQPAYQGSQRNGVVSRDWGSFAYSFTFRHPEMNGAAIAPAICAGFPREANSVTCSCPAAAPGTAAIIWGSGPYTGDSDLCSAARHDGVIGAEGGIIVAVAAAGLGAYRGSESNGVASSSWGAFERSFVFDHNAN